MMEKAPMMSDDGLIAQRDENMKNFLQPSLNFCCSTVKILGSTNCCNNGLMGLFLFLCLSCPLLGFNLASEKEFEERTLCSREC